MITLVTFRSDMAIQVVKRDIVEIKKMMDHYFNEESFLQDIGSESTKESLLLYLSDVAIINKLDVADTCDIVNYLNTKLGYDNDLTDFVKGYQKYCTGINFEIEEGSQAELKNLCDSTDLQTKLRVTLITVYLNTLLADSVKISDNLNEVITYSNIIKGVR